MRLSTALEPDCIVHTAMVDDRIFEAIADLTEMVERGIALQCRARETPGERKVGLCRRRSFCLAQRDQDPVANLAGLILPAIAVGYRYSAVSMRMTRSTVLEVLREDYVRTARAKGLRETLVVVRHALRNALLPVVTVVSLEFAFLIGGLVVTEQVFNLNGIGKLLVDAVAHNRRHGRRDPRLQRLLQGGVLGDRNREVRRVGAGQAGPG